MLRKHTDGIWRDRLDVSGALDNQDFQLQFGDSQPADTQLGAALDRKLRSRAFAGHFEAFALKHHATPAEVEQI